MGNCTRRRRLGADIVSVGMQQVDSRFTIGGSPTYGEETVVNGYFKDGITGWVQMQVVTGGHGSTDGGEGWQTVVTETGTTYFFSCVCDRQGVSPSISVKDKLPTGSSIIVMHPAGVGFNTYSGEFTALSTESVIHFGNGSDTALFDNVSIRELL